MKNRGLKSMLNSVYGSGAIGSLPSITFSTGEAKCESESEKETEWVFVEGYKGTDKDMKCRDFQYDFNKVYTMNDKDIKMCESGFHLCRDLDDVFSFYSPGNGNRFFKVRAEVKKDDLDGYDTQANSIFNFGSKLVAKNIEFLYEVSPEELCAAYRERYAGFDYAPDHYILRIFNGEDKDKVREEYQTSQLIEDGYSELVATYIAKNHEDRFDKAHALAHQDGVSMDVRMLCIMSE